jgi:hypothetical protein
MVSPLQIITIVIITLVVIFLIYVLFTMIAFQHSQIPSREFEEWRDWVNRGIPGAPD